MEDTKIKPINTKTAAAARAKYEQAHAEYARRRENTRRYSAEAISSAKAAEEAAHDDYITALQPLAAAIEEAEKHARVRLISAEDVMGELAEVERKLGIPKKHLDGVIVYIDRHAQHMPGAYNGIPKSTQFTAVYKAGSWRVTEIYRARVTTPFTRYVVTHTDASRKIIIDPPFPVGLTVLHKEGI